MTHPQPPHLSAPPKQAARVLTPAMTLEEPSEAVQAAQEENSKDTESHSPCEAAPLRPAHPIPQLGKLAGLGDPHGG